MSETGHRITDPAHARTFIFAGKALFTIKSARTGNHVTLKVKAPRGKETDKPRFVSVLDNEDGIGGYSYLGMLTEHRFTVTRKSPYYDRSTAPQVLAASWFFNQLMQGRLTEQVELWHEGRCGRCGRRLTHPESIQTGLGPECAGKI